jgi:hypothetical protein
MQQHNGKGQEMQPHQGLRQAPIVSCQATKAGCPGKTALYNPAPLKQDEAAPGVGQLDHFQPYPLLRCLSSWLVPGVTLVYKGDFDSIVSGAVVLEG